MKKTKSLSPMFPDFPRFFDDFFTKDLFDWSWQSSDLHRMTLPCINILEEDDAFVVEMAAPGMKKDDFHLELDNEMLTISSEKKDQAVDEGDRYVRKEFNYMSFKRSIHLPKSVIDTKAIKATYEDGILKVHVPKREEAKKLPPRKIEIL